MSRHTKSEIWRYFEYVNLESAKCNKCGKFYSRKGRTTTSLKNHLRSSHPQEFLEFLRKDMVRLENKRGSENYDSALVNENATTASSTSGVYGHLMYESNDHARTLESNESYSIDSITLSPTNIKQEVFIEPEDLPPTTTGPDKAIAFDNERQRIFNEEGNGKKFSSPSQKSKTYDEPGDPLDVPAKVFVDDDEFAEPFPKIRRESSSDCYNEPPYDFEELQQKQSIKDPQDRVDTSPPLPSKEDKYERWLIKRKQTLQVEYQEMLNYEMKLKIWEREQQLKLPRSKFTKNIGK